MKNMQLVIIVAAIINIMVLSSCASITGMSEDSRQFVGRYTGGFNSKVHSDGVMEFDLYSDGSVIGNWATANKTITLNIKGHYIIKNSEIIMTASGQSLIRSTIKSKVIIIAYGDFFDRECSGVFMIFIDNPNFPNDNGTWKAYKN